MKIKVAIADFPPLIFDQDKRYAGLEVDLWEAIAKIIGVDFEYEKHNFKEIIPLLAEKKVDVGLAGITVNESREKIIDFSHMTLDSGLLISVNKNRNKISITEIIKSFFHGGYGTAVYPLLSVLAFIFIFSNLFYFAEKGSNTLSDSYFLGVLQSMLAVFSLMSTGIVAPIPFTLPHPMR